MRTKYFIALNALSALLFYTAAAQQPKQLALCKKEFKAYADLLQLPGLSVAVVKDGEIIYRQMEGFADLEKKTPIREDHLFQIASVTKTFTAALMMQYEQEGKASLEDPVLNYRYINIYFGWPYNIDPNAQVRHFLSHTSAGTPGSNFVYNGRRFNFIYGVFEKAGGFKDAYPKELKARIFTPLQMEHTITGFPARRDDPVFAHIAKPYLYDTARKAFTEDTVNYRWTTAFPATGIMSTIDDLAKYTSAYDKNQLITAESYAKATTPVTLNNGRRVPYGIGWFTEELDGVQLHWHYGYADAYAALLVRVPQMKLTFILLSNSSAPSAALRLGSGRIWQSPFVTTFLKYFVWPDKFKSAAPDYQKGIASLRAAFKPGIVNSEELIGQALFRHFAAQTYGTHKGEAQQLMELLHEVNPDRFRQYDPSLIYLLTDLHAKSLQAPLQQLIDAYLKVGYIEPYVITGIAKYYEREGDAEHAHRFYKMLADSKGFEDWDLYADACKASGKYLLARGNTAEGRRYYWQAVNALKTTIGANDETLNALIQEMNNNSRK
jgi:CubicO group peptidase (beta-lactamase class C family)